jgi:hypothetical protein
MRKSEKGWVEDLILCVLSICIGASICSAQTIIQNPEKPLAKNAGRVVALKEVMKIADEGDQYFFKSPFNLKIAPDQSIFVQEQDHLWQFDRNGKFVRDYFKKGQGPGEMIYITNFDLTEEHIIMHAISPSKIMWISYQGQLAKEFTVPQKRSLMFLLFHKDVYFFNSYESPFGQGEPKFVDIPQNFAAFSEGAKELKPLMAFPIRVFIITSRSGGGGMLYVNSLISVFYQQKYLFLSHTSEYLLKLYDVETNEIVRVFQRAYKRVKAPPQKIDEKKGWMMIDGKKYFGPPAQKYSNDILNLFVDNGDLWAVTSTTDKNKGILIDVFNFEGKYIDNFHLKLPEKSTLSLGFGRPNTVTVFKGFLYGIERNEDETFSIKKYRIGE